MRVRVRCHLSRYAVVIGGVLFVVSSASAQSIGYLTFTPAVIPEAAAAPVLIEAQVTGTVTSVTVDFGPAGQATSSITLHDDGAGGDKSAGDLTLTLVITFKQPAFSGPKNIDMRANSNVGSTTNWVNRGTWTVP
jgi:hypothetical protein